MSDEQVDFLLQELVNRKEFEKACAVAIAAYSGMRKGELLQMKVEFFNDEHFVYDSMWKTDKVRAKGFGKLGHQLNKFILYGAKQYIDLWLEYRKENEIESEWMFITSYRDEDGNKKYRQRKDVDSWMEEFSSILDVDFYLHSLRHFTCTKLHRLNLPSHVIQEFFGWQSSEMLKIYNDLTAEDEFSKYFDKDGIKEISQGVYIRHIIISIIYHNFSSTSYDTIPLNNHEGGVIRNGKIGKERLCKNDSYRCK